jgi:hypothetical protein
MFKAILSYGLLFCQKWLVRFWANLIPAGSRYLFVFWNSSDTKATMVFTFCVSYFSVLLIDTIVLLVR